MPVSTPRRLGAPLALLVLAAPALAQPVSPLVKAVREAGAPNAAALSAAVRAVSPEPALLRASNADSLDYFSYSVSASGDRLLVGAPYDGGPEESETHGTGAVYVFDLRDGVWTETAVLRASDASRDANFGEVVSLDGDRALVAGARRMSPLDPTRTVTAVYVFDFGDGVWTETLLPRPSTGEFLLRSVSLDGDRAIVGGSGPVGGAFDPGAAYVFERRDGTWQETAILHGSDTGADDSFGWSVSLSGARALVGAMGEYGPFGARSFGAVYVFELQGEAWTETALLRAATPHVDAYSDSDKTFGFSVALEGDRALVGAPGQDNGPDIPRLSGAAHVFDAREGRWTKTAVLHASNAGTDDNFGWSVSLSGDHVLVGAWSEAGPTDEADNAGAAYVFELRDGAWAETSLLRASNADAKDAFGYAVSISGDHLFVGALHENGPANATVSSGAVYAFGSTATAVRAVAATAAATVPAPTLSRPRPNPASRRTTLTLTLGAPQRVRAVVLDALGREVAVLLDGEASGVRELSVDTSRLAQGMYIVRVAGASFAETRRLTVVR